MKFLARSVFSALLCGVAWMLPADAEMPKDTVVMAKQIDDIVSLDPAEVYELSGAEVVGNIYDRLVDYDRDAPNRLKPRLATSWKVDTAGRTFTFTLRDNARFATGKPVTAADAEFSLRRAVLLDKAPAVILNAIGLTRANVATAVVARGPRELEIRLPKALAPSFVYFCLTSVAGSIVDEATVLAHQSGHDLGNQWLQTHWAGTGPFRLVVWRPAEYYALEENPNYWGAKPGLRRIIVRDVKDAATQRLMLQHGDVDYARNLDRDQLLALGNDPAIRFDRGVKSAILYLGLNQKNQYLRRPEVIEALKVLIDYNGIQSALLGATGVVHQTFEPEDFMGAIVDQPYKFDLPKAKALLAKAGLAGGFAVTMDVRNATPEPEIGQAIQASFAQAGVKVKIVAGDGKQVLTKYRARHHDIVLSEWEPDYPDPHSNAEGFITNPDNGDSASMRTPAWRNAWSDPALMQAVAAALLERDDKKRAAMYEKIQRQFLAVAPFIMMFEQVEVAAHRANVQGFAIGVTSEFDRYAGIKKQ